VVVDPPEAGVVVVGDPVEPGEVEEPVDVDEEFVVEAVVFVVIVGAAVLVVSAKSLNGASVGAPDTDNRLTEAATRRITEMFIVSFVRFNRSFFFQNVAGVLIIFLEACFKPKCVDQIVICSS
jgi:hypothetical protein